MFKKNLETLNSKKMTQKELQKLLKEFEQSEIAQTPQWEIDKKEQAINNLDEFRRSDLGGKGNSSKTQSDKNKLRKYNGHKPTKKVLVYKNDKFIKEYKSLSECARQINLDKGNIQKVCKGIYKQHKGYVFKYKD